MRTLRLVIATTVRAAPEQVFAVLQDLPSYPRLFRYMHDLRVIEQRDHTALAEITEDLFGLMTASVLTKVTFDPPRRVTIEQVDGPFVRAVGWFDLEPQDDGTTRLVHGVEITASGIMGAIGLKLLGTGIAKARMTEELQAVKRAAEQLAASQ